MKSKLLQIFSYVTVIAILLSGCSGGQNGGSTETLLPSSSETTQTANGSSISDMSSDTEKENSTAGNASAPNQTDSSLSGINSQNKFDGETSDNRPNSSDPSNNQTVGRINLTGIAAK